MYKRTEASKSARYSDCYGVSFLFVLLSDGHSPSCRKPVAVSPFPRSSLKADPSDIRRCRRQKEAHLFLYSGSP